MILKEFLAEMEGIAPGAFQEDYDNSGLLIGNPEMEIKGGLICLDITPAVMDEALKKNCNLVISHHPIIFKGLKRLTGSHYSEHIIVQAIKNDIAIVAMHTNLDNIDRGVNFELATRLGLKKPSILDPRRGLLKKLVTFCPNGYAQKLRTAIFLAGAGQIGEYDCCSYNIEGLGSFRAGEEASPFVGKIRELHFEPEVRIETIFPAHLESRIVKAMKENHPYEEVAYDIYPLDNAFDKVGSGMWGILENPLSGADFLAHVKQVLGAAVIKHSAVPAAMISKVAVCGGSGAFLIQKAICVGAQAFVTSEVKFNQFFDAFPSLLLVDAGHYETEQFTKELLYEIVNKKIRKFALFISEVNTNPVSYF